MLSRAVTRARIGAKSQTTGKRYASTSSTATTSSTLLLPLLSLNLALSSYLVYKITQASTGNAKLEESLNFGMDRIDECLNRIDLRNNETTGYFERVSKRVEQLEALEKKQKK